MSCGTKINGRFDGYFEREDLSRRLEDDGEYRLASAIRRGDCLSRSDLSRAESSLDRQGLHRDWDYREQRCFCDPNEEEDY